MKLEDMILSEISASEKHKDASSLLQEVPGLVNTADTGRMAVASGWRRGPGVLVYRTRL